MRGPWKKLLIVALVLLLLPIAAGLAATAAVYSYGTIHVDVDVEDARFRVPVPAGLIPMALSFAPPEMCRELENHLEDQAEPQWDAVVTAADAFLEIPDTILVDVRSDNDRVTVEKRGERLLVNVRSGNERVSVTVPAALVASLARQLERTCS